jgi:arylsulfatase A-like enzyme
MPRLFIALAALVALTALAPPASRAAQPPPNIIFILADDLGYGDLGCYGQKRIQTPRLDRMAAEGLRFTQFYAGSTVCAPSRCVLMQGLHTGHCRVRGNAGRQNPMAQSLRPEDITVAEVLKSAGYATGLFGKWGLGDSPDAEPGLPRRQGFDEFYGYLSQVHAHNYYPTFLWRNEEKVRLRNTVPNETPAGAGKSDNKLDYSHDLIADEALDFIRRHRDRPFFLFFTPTIPHANNEARAEGMEVPDLGPYANLDWPPGVRGHAAMISRLDRDVGRVLDLLRELGIAERTLVFFSSDNGPHKEGGFDPEFNDSNGPLRGIKRDLYEGGIRVPMIVWGPGRVPAGQVSDEPWWFADFLPTAAALAGVKPPDRLDGIDASPLLRGKSLRSRPPLYWEFHERGFKQAVLRHPWKAVRLAPGEPVELYHLGRDPGETRNLAEEFPARARRLARLMDRMRVDSPDWPIRAGSSP